MRTYIFKRILHGVFSIVLVVAIVMLLIFSLLDRKGIFTNDPQYSKKSGNQRVIYEYTQWHRYGYVEFELYNDFINQKLEEGLLSDVEATLAKSIGLTEEDDSPIVTTWTNLFRETYENKGYVVERLKGRKTQAGIVNEANKPELFAYKDLNLLTRLKTFFLNFIELDSIHAIEEVENPKLTFTFFDPLAGGAFSPAILGEGTRHKYLLYFDSKFPFIHQNLITFHIGTSYSIYQGVDLLELMTTPQGETIHKEMVYPTGVRAQGSLDLHTATYAPGVVSQENAQLFGDNYTQCKSLKSGFSMIGNSFFIGSIATVLTYLIGVPIGIFMARRKNSWLSGLGSGFIIFIMAVPSLSYIFIFSSIGRSLFGLPDHFGLEANPPWLIYILPIVSLALPSIANIMKWLRRYMTDQMNAEYVKFARSLGYSERSIFRKHIFRNAVIPLLHTVPASILGSITGAIITESVYAVPGTGKLLTNAITKQDNGIIIGLTLFYATLSVVAMILGDLLMQISDPRISFQEEN